MLFRVFTHPKREIIVLGYTSNKSSTVNVFLEVVNAF